MSRPTKKESIYTVSIHHNGGHDYAATHPYVLAEDGKRKYSIKHWGTVTEGLKFIPGKAYRNATEEERAQLIFPEGWDLSEIRVQHASAESMLYGDVWLLEQIAARTGIVQMLEDALDCSHATAREILTLAFYPCLSNGSFSRISAWQQIELAPATRLLDPGCIASLLSGVGPEAVGRLMQSLLQKYGHGPLCVVDSISKSAYGESLADLRWGRKKERINLRLTVNAMVYSIEHGLPLLYIPLEKTTSDSKGISDVFEAVHGAGIDDVILVTDRAYDSTQNLIPLISEGHKMVMCTNVRQKFILDRIPEESEIGDKPEGMVYNPGIRRFVRQYGLRHHGMKLNLFFNPTRRLEEIRGLESEIASQEKSLKEIMESDGFMDDDRTLKRSYWWFNIEYDEKNRKISSFSPNEAKIRTARRTSGFYANVTSSLEMSAIEAMNVYGFKYEQERVYDRIIGQIDSGLESSDSCREGWRLIIFLSMFFGSYLSRIWSTTELKGIYRNPMEMLDEMRMARPGVQFTMRQAAIAEAFGSDASSAETTW